MTHFSDRKSLVMATATHFTEPELDKGDDLPF